MRFPRLLLATNNQHKIREMSQLLAELHVDLLSRSDFPDCPDVEESGTTLAENALLKSQAIFRKYGMPAVADDSGLEVDYLRGAPGVFSARYAGEGCSFDDNNRKLLSELDGVEYERRVARFATVIAVSSDKGDKLLEGDVEGYITETPRGVSGFGYDPVFYYPPAGKTFAEMTAEEKNRVSHRGRALEKLKAWLISG